MNFGTEKLTTFFARVAFATVLIACCGLDKVLNVLNVAMTDTQNQISLILVVAICVGYAETGQLAESWRKRKLRRNGRKDNQARPSTKRWHFMNKTVRATLIAILLGMAAGAIFAIVPAAFAQDAFVNREGWYKGSYYSGGSVNGQIWPQVRDYDPSAPNLSGVQTGSIPDLVPGATVLQRINAERSKENGYWILLSTLVFLLVFLLLISFGKFLHLVYADPRIIEGNS